MKKIRHLSFSCLGVFAMLSLSVMDVEAKCRKMGFLVNDYGKDGPSKDAQELLEKHVEKWATENKIKKYTIGKKVVSCELFLNFLVFDEHTCTASANVCWDEASSTANGKTVAEGKTPQKDKSVSEVKTSSVNTTSSEEKSSSENKASSEGKSAENTTSTVEKPLTEDKTPADVKTSLESKTSSEKKALPEDGAPSVQKTSVDDKTPSEQKAVAEDKRPTEQKPVVAEDTPAAGCPSTSQEKTNAASIQPLPTKNQVVSKTAETSRPSSSTPQVKTKNPEKSSSKSSSAPSKKPSPKPSTNEDTSEEASNSDEEETNSSDIETGSLPFFSPQKDEQPEFSRNPLTQHF